MKFEIQVCKLSKFYYAVVRECKLKKCFLLISNTYMDRGTVSLKEMFRTCINY